MVSKNTLKYITGLQQKKYRDREGVFLAQGPKLIEDLLAAQATLVSLYSLPGLFEEVTARTEVDSRTLKKMSDQKNPQGALAVFKKFELPQLKNEGFQLALDELQDPGNLGTIIRLCDWFGINDLVCSKGTVDCYNTKVVQASMGSLARVKVYYVNLKAYLSNSDLPVYGGFMKAPSVYDSQLDSDAILVMGNEGRGVSEAIQQKIQKRISIPQMGASGAESLNVAVATAVLVSEFKRTTGT